MKVIGIVCSPRDGGNTEILIREALKGAEEKGSKVELITLAGKTITPCNACRACVDTAKCPIEDDMQEIYKKLQEADGIIIGSPVYFYNVSAQAKLLIDRTYALFWEKKLTGKVAGVLVMARRLGGANVLSNLYAILTAHRMIVAGGTVGYEGEAVPYGEKGAVKKDERAMLEAKAVGKNVVRLMKSLGKQ